MKAILLIFFVLFIYCANSSVLTLRNTTSDWKSCVNLTLPIDVGQACVTFQITSDCGGVKYKIFALFTPFFYQLGQIIYQF